MYLQWELQIEAGFVHTEARGQGELQVVEAVEENELYYVQCCLELWISREFICLLYIYSYMRWLDKSIQVANGKGAGGQK